MISRNRIVISLLALCVCQLNIENQKVFAQDILKIGAIPDQHPEKLNRLYNLLSNELSKELKVKVRYIPVTSYPAAVTAFRTGSLDLVWFGGLTGVQARIQRPNSMIIAQRDIDRNFKSVFIANKNSKLPIINNVKDLVRLKDRRFTFGSESSTSGRLMPQYFIKKSGLKLSDFKGGRPGFSGSHDATIALVESGAYEAGALNKQVWTNNIKTGKTDTTKVYVIWTSPPYVDYHWLAQGNLDKRFGYGFTNKLKSVFLKFNNSNKDHKKILQIFGAKRFVPANPKSYKSIEDIGREIGKIK